MSLLAAARAAAQAEEKGHQDAAQRKLQGLLRMVLGEHAGSAVYRQNEATGDRLAEVDGMQFAEYGNKLHVFVGTTYSERPWSGITAYAAVPSLAALGHRLQTALSAADLHRQAILHNYAEVPALPDEEPDMPTGDAP